MAVLEEKISTISVYIYGGYVYYKASTLWQKPPKDMKVLLGYNLDYNPKGITIALEPISCDDNKSAMDNLIEHETRINLKYQYIEDNR